MTETNKGRSRICKWGGKRFQNQSEAGVLYCSWECREKGRIQGKWVSGYNIFEERPKRNNKLAEIDRKAAKIGISYGRYVAEHEQTKSEVI